MGNFALRKFNKKGFVIFLGVLLFFSGVLTWLIQYSNNIVSIFEMPVLEKAIIDVDNKDLEDMYSNVFLKGEWEFYYNKWIITDNYAGVSDGYLSVPEKWTGKDFGDGGLSREGYASYKLTIKNVMVGQKVIIFIKNYPNAYRAYINGELCTANGTMSKDSKETFATVMPETKVLYTVEEPKNLEVIIEISANSEGGLFMIPFIIPESHYLNDIVGNGWFGKILPFVFLGLFVSILFVTISLNIVRINTIKDYSIFVLLFLLGLHYCFSIDVAEMTFGVLSFLNFKSIHILDFVTGLPAAVSFIHVLNKFKTIRLNKKIFLIFIVISILSEILYFVFYGNNFMYYFLIAPMLFMLNYIYQLCNGIAEKNKFAIPYLVLFIFLYMCFGLEILDNTGLVFVGATSAYTIAFLIMIMSIFLISVIQVRDKTAQSQKAERLEKEINEVKNQALKAQIKPHFVFNMLTNIQDQYHKEIAAGDAALTKFSKHLRLSVDSEYKDMIPFEEELDNIQNYFDLENIRRDGKLNLLYDIDFTDFKLPILSLQPLVENAVKYGKTEEKEDGYIQIRSFEEEDKIIVEINDNGAGFAPEDLKENSTGLNNVTQRLKFSLNADVIISSEKGSGTTIKIIIPIRKN